MHAHPDGFPQKVGSYADPHLTLHTSSKDPKLPETAAQKQDSDGPGGSEIGFLKLITSLLA